MRAGHRLVFADAVILPLVRAVVLEIAAIHNLDRAVGAHDVVRQPHFAITAAPDAAEQRVV